MFHDLHESTDSQVWNWSHMLDLGNPAAELESLAAAYKLRNSGQVG